jgi:hypothetical protein
MSWTEGFNMSYYRRLKSGNDLYWFFRLRHQLAYPLLEFLSFVPESAHFVLQLLHFAINLAYFVVEFGKPLLIRDNMLGGFRLEFLEF